MPTNSFGVGYPPGNRSDIYIFQLDSLGNLIWSRTIGTYGGDVPMDLKMLPDSSILIVGMSQYNDTSTHNYPYIIRINKDKTLSYSIILYPIWGFLNQIVIHNNNIYVSGLREYYLSGYGCYRHSCILIEMDILCNIKKLKTFIPNDDCYSIIQNNLFISDKKTLLMCGRYYYGYKFYDKSRRYYAVFDTSVNLLESYIYDTINNFKEYNGLYKSYYYDINNRLLMTSAITKEEASSYYNLAALLIKTDSSLMSCENKYPLNLIEDTITYTIVPTGSITSINQGTVLSWTPTVIEGGVDSTICFCPALPVNVQTTPVNCFSNGSATVSPAPNGNYVYQWSPPVSNTNTAVNLPAGTYSVTIFDSLGCQHLSIVTITTNMSFPLTVYGNTFVCSPNAATFTASGASSYTWSTGSNDSSIVVYPNVSTIYTLVAAAGVCTQTVAVTVSVNPTPTLLLSMSSATIGIGDTLHLSLYGGNQYSFSPSENVYLQNNILSLYPRESITYCIRGEKDGCYDTVCVFVKVDGSCFDNELPNVFTPNGDGVNDEWRVRWRCPEMIKDFRMEIYDRWGVKMYESMQRDAGWDGRTTSGEAVPAGTYYYVIEFSMNGKKQELKGYITLLR